MTKINKSEPGSKRRFFFKDHYVFGKKNYVAFQTFMWPAPIPQTKRILMGLNNLFAY